MFASMCYTDSTVSWRRRRRQGRSRTPGAPGVLFRRTVALRGGFTGGTEMIETNVDTVIFAIVTYAFKSFEANSDWLGCRKCLLVGVLLHGVPPDGGHPGGDPGLGLGV